MSDFTDKAPEPVSNGEPTDPNDPRAHHAFYKLALSILCVRGGGEFRVPAVIPDLSKVANGTLMCRSAPDGSLEFRFIDNSKAGRG